MNMTNPHIKELIKKLGYEPENGKDDIYSKKYAKHQEYQIRVDFNREKIIYRKEELDKTEGIQWGDATTSNFSKSENFVVLECVDRLLEKGYGPKDIYLEKKYKIGVAEKGKLDIFVYQEEGHAYLMIECKTWGGEFVKEQNKMQKDGGQLFSYYVQDKATQYLCLYTSRFDGNEIEFKNDIISVDPHWRELSNQKEIYAYWNKYVKDNGIFEEWNSAYGVEIKSLVYSRLKTLTSEDSGLIFNQFAEILRHNSVSDKPNAFNKILNLFICKIIDEDKEPEEEVEFQWLEHDTPESLQTRLNDLYKNGMERFLGIEVTDFTEGEMLDTLALFDNETQKARIMEMFQKLRLEKNPEFAFMEVFDDVSFRRNARVVREVVELLQPFRFRYGHKQQFLGDFFELLLSTSIKQEAGQYFTPVPLARYIVSSLPIKEFMEGKIEQKNKDFIPTVIDFACGTGHFLTEYMDRVQLILKHEIPHNKASTTIQKNLRIWSKEDGAFTWANQFVYGVDADYRLVKATKVSTFLNGDGDANIIHANGLDHFQKSLDFKGKLKEISRDDSRDNGQFDMLIANPPYSVNSFKSTVPFGEESFELFERFTDSSSEIECLFVERMKQLLRVGGSAGIILPSSFLHNTGIYIKAREILLKYFKIIAVSQFGSHTFMATGTSTVALFLERRSSNDHGQVKQAVDSFFSTLKDVTVLGIEKAFSAYVSHVFPQITFSDYVSFLRKEPNETFRKEELYQDYEKYFKSLAEVKQLKKRKNFKDLPKEEQEQELKKLFYEKVLEMEKEKIFYFLLVYPQKTVVTKAGEKQAEKEFLGYTFSSRRRSEGIKMSPYGTKLYDENDLMNPEKANSYVKQAFSNCYPTIDVTLEENIYVCDTLSFLRLDTVRFEKQITLQKNDRIRWNKDYPLREIEAIADSGRGRVINKEYILQNPGNYPVYSSQTSNEGILGKIDSYDFDGEYVTWTTDGANAGTVFYRNGQFNCTNVCGTLKAKDSTLNMKYLAVVLGMVAKNFVTKVGNDKLMNNDMEKIKIPVPPSKIQDQLVQEISEIEKKEVENHQEIQRLRDEILDLLQNAKNLTESKLKTISQINPPKPSKKDYDPEEDVSFVEMASVSEKGVISYQEARKFDTVCNGGFTAFRNGDIIIAKITPCMENGKCAFVEDLQFELGYGSTEFHVIRVHGAVPKYVFYLLNQESIRQEAKSKMTGSSGHKRVPASFYEDLTLLLPEEKEQEKLVEDIGLLEEKIKLLEKENKNVLQQKKVVLERHLL